MIYLSTAQETEPLHHTVDVLARQMQDALNRKLKYINVNAFMVI